MQKKSETERLLDEKIFNLTQENNKLRRDSVSVQEFENALQEKNWEIDSLDDKISELKDDLDAERWENKELKKEIKKLNKKVCKLKQTQTV